MKRVVKLAQDDVNTKIGLPDARIISMFALADFHFKTNNPNESFVYVRELTQLQRRYEDWLLLELCHDRLNNPHAAMKAFEKAATINPIRPEVYRFPTEKHEQLRENSAAESKRRLAVRLATYK